MGDSFVLVTEPPCSFQDDVDASLSGMLRGSLSAKTDFLSTDYKSILLSLYIFIKGSIVAVILEKMCKGTGVSEVVNRFYVNFRSTFGALGKRRPMLPK